MKERFKKIMTGLFIIIFSLVGLWEYIQLYMFFDLPQAVIVLPIVGALAVVCLKKLSFLVPVVTIVISIVYQLVETRSSVVGIVELSKINILLNILPIMILLMFIGIGGGFLVRVLLNGKKSKIVGVICCVLGVVVTFGGGIMIFGNPFYPIMARSAISQYAEKFDKEDYQVSEVSVYYSMEDLEYAAKVIMSDGYVYPLYYEKDTGKVYELQK